MNMDEALRDLAERQHALVAREQSRELGLSREAWAARLAGPDWELVTPRVMKLVGAPWTPLRPIMAAVLDGGPGTVASFVSAGAVWRLPGFDVRVIACSRQRDRTGRRPFIGTLHLPRWLPPDHITEVAAVPVTSLARALFDLAGTLRPTQIERLVDSTTAKSPALLRRLHALLPELAERGRNGITVMRQILEVRPVGYIPEQTGLERRFAAILRQGGEPPLERQVDLGGHEWIGRVDFVDRAVGLVVEVDSLLHHTSLSDVRRDEARDKALLAAGWREVRRVPEEDVWWHPAAALAAVREARARLRPAA